MILFIDACVRSESRTRVLARALAERLGSYEYLKLSDDEIPALDEAMLTKRTDDCRKGNFEDDYYRFAKQFAAADEIIIAAPFWDMSFPAVLKKYIETICVTGLTFRYDDRGIPVGLCHAKRLHLVTTAGGPVFNRDYGFGYIKTLAEGMFGIPDCRFYLAENLDIEGIDVDAVMRDALDRIAKEEL